MNEKSEPFHGPECITHAWKTYIRNEPWFTEAQEMFVVFHLDTKNKIIGHHLVSLGTLDATFSHPRDVFRAAVMNNAASIIAVHNHPSGNTFPSDADIRITCNLIKCGNHLDIKLLDSIIVDNEGESYCSLKERGYFYDS